MIFRKAVRKDAEQVMHIIDNAKIAMKSNHIPQWHEEYPILKDILSDIENEYCYVLEVDNTIVAAAAVIAGIEPTYSSIHSGCWLGDYHYSTIHRLAVNNQYFKKGYASALMNNIVDLSKQLGMESIRIDTHKVNKPMQALIKKANFTYCGIVVMGDRSLRDAFELLLFP